MTRSNTFSISRGRSFLLALVLTSGCAHSTTDLRDSLDPRIKPVEGDAARPTSQPQSKASDSPRADAKVRPAAVSQPLPATAANKDEAQSTRLPAALDRPSALPDSNRPSTPAMSLPQDSDEASLDEIAATGKPVTLPEAIKLAFRYQPRLRAQVENVAQARGASRLYFRRSCQWSPRTTTSASIAWEWVANRFDWERACRDSPSRLGWEPYPSVSTPGRISSSPSSKFNGCSLTSVVGWVVTSRPDWRTTSLSFRPTVRTKRWPMTLQSPTLMF